MRELLDEDEKELFEPLLLDRFDKGELDPEKFQVIIDYEGEEEDMIELLEEHEITLIKKYPINSIIIETGVEKLLELIRNENSSIVKVCDVVGDIRMD